ncbi:MAG: DUF2189 domain-containing protein [Hyphomicrobiales bacterium]|nr:DUF2189 domain-containing protein [Hyphomicrobiales bacterium]
MSEAAARLADGANAPDTRPQIRKLGRDDLVECLMQGWRDFAAAPVYGLFFGGIYALGGIAIVSLFLALRMPYLGYPLTMGFALVVPFVAMGTYEISRRLERGEPLSWGAIFGAVWRRSGKDLGWMALVTVFALIIWIDFAIFLFLMFYGLHVPSPHDFIVEVLSTPKGLLFALVGNLVGAVVAMLVFSITVVSFPILADRDIDFVTAMITSVRCVAANPVQMMGWALLIGLLLLASLLAGFLGLFVTLPVLGSASWRLYRKLVV